MLEEPPDVRAWDLGARTAAAHVIAAGGTHRDRALLGAAATVDAHMEKMNAWVRATVELFLERGKIVGTVGGDHSVSFGAIEAHARRWPGLGILHVDAHADLRRAYEGFEHSHASIMENVTRRIPEITRLVQVGIRDLCQEEMDRIEEEGARIHTLFDVRIARARMQGRVLEIF